MASKLNENSSNKVQEFQFKATPKTTKWESFQRTLYDPSKKEFFGRTKKNWGQLLIFYTIFYACLAVFYTICMKGLIATLNDKEPKYKLSDSIIGTNPALGLRPFSENNDEVYKIQYDIKNISTSQKWISLINKFLEPYRVEQVGKNYKNCDYQEEVCSHHVCAFKIDKLGACLDNFYGYASSSPCVFLKLNRIFGWKPHVYTNATEEMPSDLSRIVEKAATRNETKVWVNCAGVNSTDRENILGFNYYPSQGFPSYYFPYTNNDNYLSPVIAVQILNVTHNSVITIECRAWAQNIYYHGGIKNREGSVLFEILVN